MARRNRDPNPLHVERIVETERRSGVDLAWLVAFGVVLCVCAIAWAVPESGTPATTSTSQSSLAASAAPQR